MSTNELEKRRRQALAPAYELFYQEPIHLVRGDPTPDADPAAQKKLKKSAIPTPKHSVVAVNYSHYILWFATGV